MAFILFIIYLLINTSITGLYVHQETAEWYEVILLFWFGLPMVLSTGLWSLVEEGLKRCKRRPKPIVADIDRDIQSIRDSVKEYLSECNKRTGTESSVKETV